MVRYIKDGAYTIIIEDNPAEGKDGENKGSSSKPSSPMSPEELRRQKEEEDDGTGENIDFASPEFMLQNLSLARPKFEEDRSNLLRGRHDIAKFIMYQIAFYVYCALQPFSNASDPPTILVMGDGFIGAKVITFLAENGCTPLLRVYSRGEIGAKEWKQRGFQSNSNLVKLMKDQKPNIIIICSEYSSFHMIYHQLSDLNMLTNNACIITSTLGFQRKKLYYNFSIPTILRTYVEPQKQVASYRSNIQKAILAMLQNDIMESGTQQTNPVQASTLSQQANSLASPTKDDNISVITDMNDEDDGSIDDSQTDLSSTTHSKTSLSLIISEDNAGEANISDIEKAARILGERNYGIKSLLGLFENFYALQDISFSESRRMALRAIVGYVGIQNNANISRSPSRNRSRQAKRGQVAVKHVEKICISLLTSVGKTFQEELSKILPVMELNQIVEEVLKVEVEENESREMYIDPTGKHHYLKRIVPIHRVYTMPQINEFLAVDDDYSQYQGAAFDFMRAIDERDQRRGSMTSAMSGGFSPFKPPPKEPEKEDASQTSGSVSHDSLGSLLRGLTK